MKYFIFPNSGGKKIIWNETEPSGQVQGYDLKADDLWVNETSHGISVYNGSDFVAKYSEPVVFSNALTVGAAGTGYDVTFYGDTSGCSFLWDQSEDQLVLTGPADVPVLKIAGAGSYSSDDFAAAGTAWADAGTPAFVADQKFLLIDIAGTTYRIPLWANS
jgi:hypothetical protein